MVVLSSKSCIPREQGRSSTLTISVFTFACDEISTVGSYYGDRGATEIKIPITDPADTHTLIPLSKSLGNVGIIFYQSIGKMFPKATFTSRSDLAHCLSQLKIRPWKNDNSEAAYLQIISQTKEGGQLTRTL